MGEELTDHLVQRPHGGIGREAEPADREALVAFASERTMACDLLAVIGAAEGVHDGRLA